LRLILPRSLKNLKVLVPTGNKIFPLKVSVVTPSYNQGEFIEETILSVLNQTYQNIEYIIIDGGSTDNSVAIIKKYEDKLKYWISEKDKGQSDALNKGFKIATGEFLCWINSDDILYPDFIEKRLKEFKLNPNIDLIYGDVEQGIETSKKVLRKGWQTNFDTILNTGFIPIPQQSAIWKRDILKKVGFLDIKLHVLLDFDYFFRISHKANIKYIPGTVAFFRNHPDSKSIKLKLKWIEEIERFITEPSYTASVKNDRALALLKYNLNKWIYDLAIEIDDQKIKQKYWAILMEAHSVRFLINNFKGAFLNSLIRLKKSIHA
jgi:glycosyltransferase involved in cell wall biosynthesis